MKVYSQGEIESSFDCLMLQFYDAAEVDRLMQIIVNLSDSAMRDGEEARRIAQLILDRSAAN